MSNRKIKRNRPIQRNYYHYHPVYNASTQIQNTQNLPNERKEPDKTQTDGITMMDVVRAIPGAARTAYQVAKFPLHVGNEAIKTTAAVVNAGANVVSAINSGIQTGIQTANATANVINTGINTAKYLGITPTNVYHGSKYVLSKVNDALDKIPEPQEYELVDDDHLNTHDRPLEHQVIYNNAWGGYNQELSKEQDTQPMLKKVHFSSEEPETNQKAFQQQSAQQEQQYVSNIKSNTQINDFNEKLINQYNEPDLHKPSNELPKFERGAIHGLSWHKPSLNQQSSQKTRKMSDQIKSSDFQGYEDKSKYMQKGKPEPNQLSDAHYEREVELEKASINKRNQASYLNVFPQAQELKAAPVSQKVTDINEAFTQPGRKPIELSNAHYDREVDLERKGFEKQAQNAKAGPLPTAQPLVARNVPQQTQDENGNTVVQEVQEQAPVDNQPQPDDGGDQANDGTDDNANFNSEYQDDTRPDWLQNINEDGADDEQTIQEMKEGINDEINQEQRPGFLARMWGGMGNFFTQLTDADPNLQTESDILDHNNEAAYEKDLTTGEFTENDLNIDQEYNDIADQSNDAVNSDYKKPFYKYDSDKNVNQELTEDQQVWDLSEEKIAQTGKKGPQQLSGSNKKTHSFSSSQNYQEVHIGEKQKTQEEQLAQQIQEKKDSIASKQENIPLHIYQIKKIPADSRTNEQAQLLYQWEDQQNEDQEMEDLRSGKQELTPDMQERLKAYEERKGIKGQAYWKDLEEREKTLDITEEEAKELDAKKLQDQQEKEQQQRDIRNKPLGQTTNERKPEQPTSEPTLTPETKTKKSAGADQDKEETILDEDTQADIDSVLNGLEFGLSMVGDEDVRNTYKELLLTQTLPNYIDTIKGNLLDPKYPKLKKLQELNWMIGKLEKNPDIKNLRYYEKFLRMRSYIEKDQPIPDIYFERPLYQLYRFNKDVVQNPQYEPHFKKSGKYNYLADLARSQSFDLGARGIDSEHFENLNKNYRLAHHLERVIQILEQKEKDLMSQGQQLSLEGKDKTGVLNEHTFIVTTLHDLKNAFDDIKSKDPAVLAYEKYPELKLEDLEKDLGIDLTDRSKQKAQEETEREIEAEKVRKSKENEEIANKEAERLRQEAQIEKDKQEAERKKLAEEIAKSLGTYRGSRKQRKDQKNLYEEPKKQPETTKEPLHEDLEYKPKTQEPLHEEIEYKPKTITLNKTRPETEPTEIPSVKPTFDIYPSQYRTDFDLNYKIPEVSKLDEEPTSYTKEIKTPSQRPTLLNNIINRLDVIASTRRYGEQHPEDKDNMVNMYTHYSNLDYVVLEFLKEVEKGKNQDEIVSNLKEAVDQLKQSGDVAAPYVKRFERALELSKHGSKLPPAYLKTPDEYYRDFLKRFEDDEKWAIINRDFGASENRFLSVMYKGEADYLDSIGLPSDFYKQKSKEYEDKIDEELNHNALLTKEARERAKKTTQLDPRDSGAARMPEEGWIGWIQDAFSETFLGKREENRKKLPPPLSDAELEFIDTLRGNTSLIDDFMKTRQELQPNATMVTDFFDFLKDQVGSKLKGYAKDGLDAILDNFVPGHGKDMRKILQQAQQYYLDSTSEIIDKRRKLHQYYYNLNQTGVPTYTPNMSDPENTLSTKNTWTLANYGNYSQDSEQAGEEMHFFNLTEQSNRLAYIAILQDQFTPAEWQLFIENNPELIVPMALEESTVIFPGAAPDFGLGTLTGHGNIPTISPELRQVINTMAEDFYEIMSPRDVQKFMISKPYYNKIISTYNQLVYKSMGEPQGYAAGVTKYKYPIIPNDFGNPLDYQKRFQELKTMIETLVSHNRVADFELALGQKDRTKLVGNLLENIMDHMYFPTGVDSYFRLHNQPITLYDLPGEHRASIDNVTKIQRKAYEQLATSWRDDLTREEKSKLFQEYYKSFASPYEWAVDKLNMDQTSGIPHRLAGQQFRTYNNLANVLSRLPPSNKFYNMAGFGKDRPAQETTWENVPPEDFSYFKPWTWRAKPNLHMDSGIKPLDMFRKGNYFRHDTKYHHGPVSHGPYYPTIQMPTWGRGYGITERQWGDAIRGAANKFYETKDPDVAYSELTKLLLTTDLMQQEIPSVSGLQEWIQYNSNLKTDLERDVLQNWLEDILFYNADSQEYINDIINKMENQEISREHGFELINKMAVVKQKTRLNNSLEAPLRKKFIYTPENLKEWKQRLHKDYRQLAPLGLVFDIEPGIPEYKNVKYNGTVHGQYIPLNEFQAVEWNKTLDDPMVQNFMNIATSNQKGLKYGITKLEKNIEDIGKFLLENFGAQYIPNARTISSINHRNKRDALLLVVQDYQAAIKDMKSQLGDIINTHGSLDPYDYQLDMMRQNTIPPDEVHHFQGVHVEDFDNNQVGWLHRIKNNLPKAAKTAFENALKSGYDTTLDLLTYLMTGYSNPDQKYPEIGKPEDVNVPPALDSQAFTQHEKQALQLLNKTLTTKQWWNNDQLNKFNRHAKFVGNQWWNSAKDIFHPWWLTENPDVKLIRESKEASKELAPYDYVKDRATQLAWFNSLLNSRYGDYPWHMPPGATHDLRTGVPIQRNWQGGPYGWRILPPIDALPGEMNPFNDFDAWPFETGHARHMHIQHLMYQAGIDPKNLLIFYDGALAALGQAQYGDPWYYEDYMKYANRGFKGMGPHREKQIERRDAPDMDKLIEQLKNQPDLAPDFDAPTGAPTYYLDKQRQQLLPPPGGIPGQELGAEDLKDKEPTYYFGSRRQQFGHRTGRINPEYDIPLDRHGSKKNKSKHVLVDISNLDELLQDWDSYTSWPPYNLTDLRLTTDLNRTYTNKTREQEILDDMKELEDLLNLYLNRTTPSGRTPGSRKGKPHSAPSGTPGNYSSTTHFPSGRTPGSRKGKPPSTPSILPSGSPSGIPSTTPSGVPSGAPSISPSGVPPGKAPGSRKKPTVPSGVPSGTPSAAPSGIPSASPSGVPSTLPSGTPFTPPSVGPGIPPKPKPYKKVPVPGPNLNIQGNQVPSAGDKTFYPKQKIKVSFTPSRTPVPVPSGFSVAGPNTSSFPGPGVIDPNAAGPLHGTFPGKKLKPGITITATGKRGITTKHGYTGPVELEPPSHKDYSQQEEQHKIMKESEKGLWGSPVINIHLDGQVLEYSPYVYEYILEKQDAFDLLKKQILNLKNKKHQFEICVIDRPTGRLFPVNPDDIEIGHHFMLFIKEPSWDDSKWEQFLRKNVRAEKAVHMENQLTDEMELLPDLYMRNARDKIPRMKHLLKSEDVKKKMQEISKNKLLKHTMHPAVYVGGSIIHHTLKQALRGIKSAGTGKPFLKVINTAKNNKNIRTGLSVVNRFAHDYGLPTDLNDVKKMGQNEAQVWKKVMKSSKQMVKHPNLRNFANEGMTIGKAVTDSSLVKPINEIAKDYIPGLKKAEDAVSKLVMPAIQAKKAFDNHLKGITDIDHLSKQLGKLDQFFPDSGEHVKPETENEDTKAGIPQN